jgi:TatD DNase family protein
MLINIHTHFQRGSGIEVVNASSSILPNALFSCGVHPWQADLGEIELIRNAANSKNCLAIGEIGLDKLKGPALDIQQACFINQVLLAEELNLPVIIHCVKSWNELKAIKQTIQPKQPWIFHGFVKINLLEDVLQQGLYVSIGAVILKNESLQTILPKIPLHQLFLETDTSETSIEAVYKSVSEIKNIPLYDLEKQLEENFKRVFNRWETGLSELNY